MQQLLLLLFTTIIFSASAQNVIKGRVIDADDREPLPAASARIIDKAGKIKKFASTNAAGQFSITIPAGDSLRLQFAKMSYSTIEYRLDTLNMADSLFVSLPVNAVRLNEVGVRAKRIRENGDTVTYNVGAFTRKQDRSIGEVMNRMPGLEVDESGKVQYQGTDINKLYVEGNDVTGGKYGVVTKNVQAKDVKAVEVLENHQPMQVLRGLSFSDQAAVNLKLKEGAKAKVTAHGDIGTGYCESEHFLYLGELFTMTIKGNVQNITSLKLNNTGTTLGGTNTGFYGSNGGESLNQYISIGGVEAVNNRSATFSTSTTWKNRHSGQWRVQGDYGYDHLWADNSSVKTYFLPEGDRIIVEDRHGDSHTHSASLTANYELNQKTYYLNNNLTFNGSWADTDIDITGTLGNRQQASTPSYDISNRLKVIKRFGEKHMITFNSTNQWLYKPQNLWVDLDNTADNGTVSRYGSDVRQQAFFTDERASYGFIMGKVIATVEGGVAAFIRHLESGITGDVVLPDIDAENDFSTNYLRVFAQPKLELNLRRINFNLTVPLNYYSYFFGGALKNRNEVFVSPNLSIQWKPNARHTVNIAASARRTPASLGNILRGDILADYRTFNAGIDDYYAFTGQTVQGRWEWRNPRVGWFGTLFLEQSWNQMKYGTAQTIIGDYVINSYRSEPSKSESSSIFGRVQKSLDALSSTISFNAGYRRGSSSVFSQGNPVDRKTGSLSLSTFADMKFLSWLNGTYGFGFARNTLDLSDMPSNRIDSYSHNFSLSATPGKWIFRVYGNHNRTRIERHVYENVLSIAGFIRYHINSRFQLQLNAHNLLDKRRIVNRSFSELGSVESTSYRRGRQFLVTLRIIK